MKLTVKKVEFPTCAICGDNSDDPYRIPNTDVYVCDGCWGGVKTVLEACGIEVTEEKTTK